jgi:cell division protein FtsN
MEERITGPKVVKTLPGPEPLENEPSNWDGKPGFAATMSVEKPSEQGHPEYSPSILEGTLARVESEIPVYGYEGMLYAWKTDLSEPPSVTEDTEPSAPSDMLEKSTQFPYSLRLGAFRTLDRAKKAVAAYRRNGLSPYWVKVDLGEEGVWFRVYIGHFENREQAQRFREEHGLKKSLVKETRYSTLVGVYDDKAAMEKEVLSLQKLECSPYAIKGHDEKYHLFVGAFITEEGAEAQRLELESKGVQGRIVRR